VEEDVMAQNYIWGPTFEEMLCPEKIPEKLRREAIAAMKEDLLSPLNLFNINWRDEESNIRYVILPQEITGVDAEICVLIGCFFPTGSHKVGATYSCAVEKQVLELIKPGRDTLVWPSTGNYGIGGAYVGKRMGYDSIVVLPEGMSEERFQRIERYGGSYVKTRGSESNVKEIYDKVRELAAKTNTTVVNQFAEFGNYRFHYYVTGNTLLSLFEDLKGRGLCRRFSGFVSAMGSAGTIASGDRVKQDHSNCRIVGLEPVQCPTLYSNGFGEHDIQGIGDEHVTWIHHTDNIDALMCIDEWDCKKGMQLMYEDEGLRALESYGVNRGLLERMRGLFGISSICNILGSIKAAKFYNMGREDMIFTVATDGIDRYHSVLDKMNKALGPMSATEAKQRLESIFHRQGVDYIREGSKHAHDCWANLKYFTWVEQQGKDVKELDAQRSCEYWEKEQSKVAEIDKGIRDRRGF
jgi:cysteine synthase A